jgi:hypothetical protein
MEAGIGELGLGFETGYREHSMAALVCLPDRRVQERCLSDARFADHQQGGAMICCSREGGFELSNLRFPPDQPCRHATKIRGPVA